MNYRIIILLFAVLLVAGCTSTTSTPSNISATPSSYTMAQVAAHATPGDCWTVINGNVYDVTGYLPMHPGGEQSIIAVCGKDGTAAFDTRGGRGPHPSSALEVLQNYFVGQLSS